jgi:hypothetical protein
MIPARGKGELFSFRRHAPAPSEGQRLAGLVAPLLAAARTDCGWSAEFAISYLTLRYQPGEGRTWGHRGMGMVRRDLQS